MSMTPGTLANGGYCFVGGNSLVTLLFRLIMLEVEETASFSNELASYCVLRIGAAGFCVGVRYEPGCDGANRKD
jgi:hypothetical protein